MLIPGIVRPRAEGGYELIAGHRRKHGSELAGKTEPENPEETGTDAQNTDETDTTENTTDGQT